MDLTFPCYNVIFNHPNQTKSNANAQFETYKRDFLPNKTELKAAI